MSKYLYFGIAAIIGYLSAIAFFGGGVVTRYHLDGKLLSTEMNDSKFVINNISTIETVTFLDYDGLFDLLDGVDKGWFDPILIEGDVGTPSTIHNVVIAIHVCISLLIAWFVKIMVVSAVRKTLPQPLNDET